jgi:octaprenyl-diphosphate synthase
MDSIQVLREVARRDGSFGRIATVLKTAADLVGEDLRLLDNHIVEACRTAPGMLKDISSHIVESGGKHIRPILCLLSYRALGGTSPLPMDLAASCELIHNATLLHDDVIDEGNSRRGRPAARICYSNALSVLGGDFLLVKTIECISRREPIFMQRYIETMHKIVEGELTQLLRRGSIETTEEEYFHIIEGKTASLFRWSVVSGALAASATRDDCEAVGEFGRHVGISFQLMDDVLDYTADPERLGKSLLLDISEGKMTLPVILAMRKSSKVKQLMSELVAASEPSSIRRIAETVSSEVRALGVAREVRDIAEGHTAEGLLSLRSIKHGDKEVIDVIADLAAALLDRDF